MRRKTTTHSAHRTLTVSVLYTRADLRRIPGNVCPRVSGASRALRVSVGVLLLTLASPARGGEPSHQDLLFFGPERPILIRVHLELDGRPAADAWRDHVDRLFRLADRNGDGALTPDEVAAPLPADEPLADESAAPLTSPALWQADVNFPDGRMSRDEFAAFVRSTGRGPFQFSPQDTGAVANPAFGMMTAANAGEVLFRALDRVPDGRLTREELESAPDSLRRSDLDGDGAVSLDEIDHARSPFGQPVNRQGQLSATPVYPVAIDSSASELVSRMLGGGMIPLPAAMPRDAPVEAIGPGVSIHDRYDANRDGRLDRDELRYYLAHPTPDVELRVRIGRREPGQPAAEIVRSPDDPSVVVRSAEPGLVVLVLGQVQVEIGAGRDGGGADALEQQVVGMFKGFDRDGNGYLDRQEAPDGTPFGLSFGLFDRNGDGMIYEAEVLGVVRGRIPAALCRSELVAANRGQDLFEILDANRDRRLSRREASSIAARLPLWDRDGDGSLAESEVPHLYQLTFRRGTPDLPGFPFSRAAAQGMAPQQTGPAAPGTPRWFQKMDVNGDGEITAREFLGTAEQFRAIDADGDGLVGPEEASAYGAPPRR
jgi:Ca2+-binding EF-hand superfamily protein